MFAFTRQSRNFQHSRLLVSILGMLSPAKTCEFKPGFPASLIQRGTKLTLNSLGQRILTISEGCASQKYYELAEIVGQIDASASPRRFSVPTIPIKPCVCLSNRKVSVPQIGQKLRTSHTKLHFRFLQPVRHLKF